MKTHFGRRNPSRKQMKLQILMTAYGW